MGLFSRVFHIGKKTKLGTQAVILSEDPEDVPVQEEFGVISEDLRAKFQAFADKRTGLRDVLDEISHQYGRLRVQESELWNEVYKELGVESDHDLDLSLKRDTGKIMRTIRKDSK